MPIGTEIPSYSKFFNRRSVFGVFFIVLAVALVLASVHFAAQKEGYLVARDTIVAGQRLEPADYTVVNSNLGAAASHYFRAGELGKNAVAVQSVGAGELIARTAISNRNPGLKQLVVRLAAPLPHSVKAGDILELWKLPNGKDLSVFEQDELPQEVTQLSKQAVFVSTDQTSNSVNAGRQAAIEVMVPTADIPAVLAALGVDSELMAVPVAS